MNTTGSSSISDRPGRAGSFGFSVWAIVAAFSTYFCMYAFRKPFTAATFDDASLTQGSALLQNIGFKTLLVTSQLAGYTLSKFLGIKFVSEMPASRRVAGILLLIGTAEAALFLFAITPPPWNFIWMFMNGLSLGMVFGLVLAFLEGRQVTEALTAGLCASFILASGVVKSVGRRLIEDGVSEFWMPFWTGMIFVPPLLVGVWMLSRIPQPSETDVAHRARRPPMTRSERRAFLRRHATGLSGLLFIFVLLTVLRSIRDDFAVEIWKNLGIDRKPDVFARSEFWVMIAVTAVSGAAIVIRNNRVAFLTSLMLVGLGFALILATVSGHRAGWLSPFPFMVLLGLGMYVPYVIFHTTIFERLIAASRETGNLGYLMYLADSLGYLGYVVLMIAKNCMSEDMNYLRLLNDASVLISVVALAVLAVVAVHYSRRLSRVNPAPGMIPAAAVPDD